MQKVISGAVSALVLLVFPAFVQAALPVRNQNPFVQFVGIPGMADAQKLKTGQQVFALNTTLSSHFVLESAAGEVLWMDGESYVGDLHWRRGFTGWELEVIVPYVSLQKGFMDGFIQDFHKAFNLPNGDRDKVDDHEFRFLYQGKNNAGLDKPAQGLGDVRIGAGWQVKQTAAYQHAVQLMLKLPTGNSNRWLGSGGADLSVYTTHRWLYGNWQLDAQLGAVLMQKPDILPDQRRPFAVFGGIAAGYQLFERWWVILQWDAHSGLYKDTQQIMLGDGHILTGGVEYRGGQWRVQVALLEDIKVDSAPDVGGLIGIQWFPAHSAP